ncbi:hypothetical protein BGZ57DRAFT_927203 [Hyaloscypha finlandica]|nr:hypothetical protein BGZ57DRAFT_927203 [Hyaloscypha finlandica]
MSLDQELQQYLYAIAAARQEPCTGSENLDIFLDRHLEQEDTGPPLNILPVSFSYMKDIVEAMEFFTEFCVLLFAKGHGALYTPPLGISNLLYGRPKEEQRKLLETCLPLSMWDKHRIRRALLRFQLYCELFHQPGESLASDNKDDWEGRLSEQELFWLRSNKVTLARRLLGLRAPPIPSDQYDHNLDNNQGHLYLQHVSPWQVELKPNPINENIDTYCLHSYYSIPDGGLADPTLPPSTAVSSPVPGSTRASPTPAASSSSSTNLLPSISNQIPNHIEFNAPARTISPNQQLPPTTEFGPLESLQSLSNIPAPCLSTGSTSGGDQSEIITPQFELNSPSNFGSQSSPPRGQPIYPCALCNQEFEKQYMLNRHHRTIHNKRFACTVVNCQQDPFGLRKDLRRHQASCHPLLYPPVSFRCRYGDCPYATKGFPVRTIYSGTFENSTNSSTHQGTFMSEEFKIMPTEGSTTRRLAAEIASLLNRMRDALLQSDSKYYCRGSPNDPSNNTSKYDIFKTTENSPLYTWDSCISDFPLKNAPLAPATNSREYQKKYNDPIQALVRLSGLFTSIASSPGLLDDSEYCRILNMQRRLLMGSNKDYPRLARSQIMAFGRKRAAVRLFEVRPEYPYPFDYHET